MFVPQTMLVYICQGLFIEVSTIYMSDNMSSGRHGIGLRNKGEHRCLPFTHKNSKPLVPEFSAAPARTPTLVFAPARTPDRTCLAYIDVR